MRCGWSFSILWPFAFLLDTLHHHHPVPDRSHSPVDHSRSSSSSALQQLPRRDWPVSSAFLTWPASPDRPSQSASSAQPNTGDLSGRPASLAQLRTPQLLVRFSLPLLITLSILHLPIRPFLPHLLLLVGRLLVRPSLAHWLDLARLVTFALGLLFTQLT